jgi:hypothetical protein
MLSEEPKVRILGTLMLKEYLFWCILAGHCWVNPLVLAHGAVGRRRSGYVSKCALADQVYRVYGLTCR